MTDNQLHSSLQEALAVAADAQLSQAQLRAAAATALAGITVTRETFRLFISEHCNTLHDYGTPEIHQVIGELAYALDEATDRLNFISTEGK
jgi:hypothetical protein